MIMISPEHPGALPIHAHPAQYSPVANHTVHDVSNWSIGACLLDVNVRLERACAHIHNQPLRSITEEHLRNPGRRFRARMALSLAHAHGVEKGQAVAWAAAVEMLHNATLVHDDVMDRDVTRRGKPSVWSQHGDAAAITAGAAMMMLPYVIVTEDVSPRHVPALCRALAVHSCELASGQFADGVAAPPVWERYERMARQKTGALFSLPAKGSLILADADADRARRIVDTFEDVGLAFQIHDDVLDIVGGKQRLNRRSDLEEGRVTAVVVKYLEVHPHRANHVLSVLRRSRSMDGPTLLDELLKEVRHSSAVTQARDQAERLMSHSAVTLRDLGLAQLGREVQRLFEAFHPATSSLNPSPVKTMENQEL